MNFDAFDKTELERYAAEVREKWGGTTAYQEYRQRGVEGSVGDFSALSAQFAALGKLKALSPTAPEVQSAVRDLQQLITDRFYTCTPEILAGLGKMYVSDGRFRRSIDKAGGDGTAEFVSHAIRAYCGQ